MRLTDLTIREAHELLTTKKISSVELTQAMLDRIHGVDKKVKSYVTVTDDLALEQAKKADERIAKGVNVSPLTGIPFSMKDCISTRDVRTTRSSKILENYVPQYNATVTTKLADSGAVLVGKTNMDEFGMGSSCENLPIASGRSASKGVVSEDHPLALGTSGSFGWPIANEYLRDADCWLAIGTTFSQIAMQDWSVPAPATLIHVGIDPAEIGKIYKPTVGIIGDAKLVLAQIRDHLRAKTNAAKNYRTHPRFAEIEERGNTWRAALDAMTASSASPINPFRVMRELNAALPPDGIVTGGAGNNGEFAVHALKSFQPLTFLLSLVYRTKHLNSISA